MALVAHVLHQPMPVIEAWPLRKLFVMAEMAKIISGRKPKARAT